VNELLDHGPNTLRLEHEAFWLDPALERRFAGNARPHDCAERPSILLPDLDHQRYAFERGPSDVDTKDAGEERHPRLRAEFLGAYVGR
jgi:hypothetical protein